MTVIVGSARVDERGKFQGGAAGDQTGREVATENFYVHSQGWDIVRAKAPAHRLKIAERMQAACNNPNVGYSMSDRYGINRGGIDSNVPVNGDCSSLARQCVKEGTGTDPGDMTTANLKAKLLATGLFEYVGKYNSNTVLMTGDILVTCTKGHVVIVVKGADTDEDKSSSGSNTDAPRVANPPLQIGAHGEEVKVLQQNLNSIIHSNLSVDGVFGKCTHAAVQQFQKSCGINPSGIYGVQTQAAIRKKLKQTGSKKTNEEIAKEVIQGKWGNNPERKQKLIEAGYDYEAIRKIVNERY